MRYALTLAGGWLHFATVTAPNPSHLNELTIAMREEDKYAQGYETKKQIGSKMENGSILIWWSWKESFVKITEKDNI